MSKKKKKVKRQTVKEAVADYSYDQMRDLLQDELSEQMSCDGDDCTCQSMDDCQCDDGMACCNSQWQRPYIVDVYPDKVIYRVRGDIFSVGYQAEDGDGGPEVTFDDPVEVFVTYTPVAAKEAVTAEFSPEIKALIEAGKMFSAANMKTMTDALGKIGSAHDQIKAAHGALQGMLGVSESLQEAETPTKTVDGRKLTADQFAHVPHSHKPSTWQLPIHDSSHISAAAAALGKGFRGKKVQIPDADLPKVKAKVRAAWKKAWPDKKPAEMPEGIKEAEGDEGDGLMLMEAGLAEDMVTPIMEAAIRTDGTMPIKIIDPGWGTTGYYGREMLERDAAKFPVGTQMFLDHATKAERSARPEGSVARLAATLVTDGRFMEHAPAGYKAKNDGPGIYADALVVDSHRKLIEDLAPHIGLSINGSATNIKYGEAEGKRGPIIEGIDKVQSVDFVTRAGRGGEILQIMESYQDTEFQSTENEVKDMDETEAKALQESNSKLETENKRLAEALMLHEAGDVVAEMLADKQYDSVPDVTKTRLAESLAKNPVVKDGALDRDAFKEQVKEAVKAEMEYLAQITGAGRVTGNGPRTQGLGEAQVGENAEDLHKKRVERFKRQGLSEAAAEAAARGRR